MSLSNPYHIDYESVEVFDERVRITVRCPSCAQQNPVVVPKESWERFQSGVFVQRAFPDLPPEEREMLLSGFCPTCWNEMFPPDDEGDAA